MQDIDAIDNIYTLEVSRVLDVVKSELALLENMEPKSVLLLHTYKSVFDQPAGLPPTGAHDHGIPLIKGSRLVKVKVRV